jgi:hypothetical protein
MWAALESHARWSSSRPGRRGLRLERGEGGLGVVVGLVLAAGLIAAVGFVLVGRSQTDEAKRDLRQIDTARSAEAQGTLAAAMQTAQLYFSEEGTFAGFTPEAASAREPSIAWTAGPAMADQVSIRGASATGIALVTSTAPGTFACVAANGPAVTYGTQDAAAPAACTG